MQILNVFFLLHQIENLKSVIAKQETRCMELEKTSADNDSKKKKALTDVKTIEEKLAKQENLVSRIKRKTKRKKNEGKKT